MNRQDRPAAPTAISASTAVESSGHCRAFASSPVFRRRMRSLDKYGGSLMNLVCGCGCEELRVEESFCLLVFAWGLDGNSKVRRVEAMESDVSKATFSGKNLIEKLRFCRWSLLGRPDRILGKQSEFGRIGLVDDVKDSAPQTSRSPPTTPPSNLSQT